MEKSSRKKVTNRNCACLCEKMNDSKAVPTENYQINIHKIKLKLQKQNKCKLQKKTLEKN